MTIVAVALLLALLGWPPATLGGRQWIVRRIGFQQGVAESIDEFKLPSSQVLQALGKMGMCPSETAIALDPVGDPHLVASGHMDLAHLPAVGGAKDLGFVKLPTSAPATRVAADARPGTEGASDQRSALSEEKHKLLVKFVLSFEEALAEAARVVCHGSMGSLLALIVK
jgi:hypothetical protein